MPVAVPHANYPWCHKHQFFEFWCGFIVGVRIQGSIPEGLFAVPHDHLRPLAGWRHRVLCQSNAHVHRCTIWTQSLSSAACVRRTKFNLIGDPFVHFACTLAMQQNTQLKSRTFNKQTTKKRGSISELHMRGHHSKRILHGRPCGGQWMPVWATYWPNGRCPARIARPGGSKPPWKGATKWCVLRRTPPYGNMRSR